MRVAALLLACEAALVVVVVGACQSSATSDEAAPDQQWALVQNRFYIERMPKNERDVVKDVAFIKDEDHGNVGIRVSGSRFRLFLDVLTWKRDGNRLESTILQTNDKVRGTFRAWKCKGEAPAPFELCLEL